MLHTTHYKIKEISEVINGSTPSTKEEDNYDGDIIWLTPKDLSDQRTKYIYQGERNITKKGYDSCGTKMIPPDNIIMSSRAPIGLLSINKNECCTNQGFKSLILNKNLADTNYMYYFIKHHMPQIEALGSGTTFKEVSKDSMENYEIDIPDLLTQKKIADVLSCIDDKIALNNKTNTELENMAKTIYDYWFTQFDFPDKNGQPYKTSGGQMVYNETLKREIPAGWEVGKLGLYLENFGDGIHGTPEYDDSGEYYFINGNNLGNKLISFYSDTLKVNDEEYEKIQRPLNENTILLSINGTLGSISFYNGEKISIGKSACFLNVTEKEFKPFIYQILCSEKFQKYMYTVASGSTIKNFAPRQAADFDIPIPPKDLLEQFYNTTYSYLENQIKNEKENKELTKLHDYLLPLLMNGQIEVK